MKFGDLIIRKIFKFVATKCQILRLKIQIQFRPGLRPRYRWGSLQRSPDLLTEFNGPTSDGLEEKAWEIECDREGEVRGKAGTRKGWFTPPCLKS